MISAGIDLFRFPRQHQRHMSHSWTCLANPHVTPLFDRRSAGCAGSEVFRRAKHGEP